MLVRIEIIPDNLVELTESFFAELAITSQQDNEGVNIVLCQNRAEVTIQDDDSKFSFQTTTLNNLHSHPNILF